jgi:hypothetical protein
MVTLADAELPGFALLWAVTMIDPVGALAGAVYRPAELIVPTDKLPPAMPETSQFTEVLLVPETVALNCCDWPTCKFALAGETETETVAGLTDTAALADAAASAALWAVIVI